MATEVKAMEMKKPERELQNQRSEVLSKFKIREWVEETKHEIRTIHWTSREELRVYTQIVVGATFFFGMGVYVVDLAIHAALHSLSWMAQMLVG